MQNNTSADAQTRAVHALSPVDMIPGDENAQLKDGVALCLSGGGYRAMLFHVGALWRLNEMGLLQDIVRISSVSGGSITAATLGMNWNKLDFDQKSRVARQFDSCVVSPLRKLAATTIDTWAVVTGLVPPRISRQLAKAYQKKLFGETTLGHLPDSPRFVFNATNIQSKSLWRFSKPYMRDWRVGKVPMPKCLLAEAVAASSAFPPFLSPLKLNFREKDFEPGSGAELQEPPYTTSVYLTDGGVYDNLGLETAWKQYRTVLISDGGGRIPSVPSPRINWPFQTYRILNLLDDQVRSLRKRQILEGFKNIERKGAYWSAWTDIDDFGLSDSLHCSFKVTTKLAETPTRLKAMEDRLQERLINWGYAISDAALRKYGGKQNQPSAKFPYPNGVDE